MIETRGIKKIGVPTMCVAHNTLLLFDCMYVLEVLHFDFRNKLKYFFELLKTWFSMRRSLDCFYLKYSDTYLYLCRCTTCTI